MASSKRSFAPVASLFFCFTLSGTPASPCSEYTPQNREKQEDSSSLANPVSAHETYLHETYLALLADAAEREQVDVCLAQAIYAIESVFGPYYISSTGAVGLMQLMPRDGSFITENYAHYEQARKTKERSYRGKTVEEWATAYQIDLIILLGQQSRDLPTLYRIDSRFDPTWNIQEGVRQLSADYHHFQAKGYADRTAAHFAIASYNAGRDAVEKGKDHIPQNGETERYTAGVLSLYDRCYAGH